MAPGCISSLLTPRVACPELTPHECSQLKRIIDDMDPGVLSSMRELFKEVDTAKTGYLSRAQMHTLLTVRRFLCLTFVLCLRVNTCGILCMKCAQYRQETGTDETENGYR
jgi:hypothetical protein